MSVITQWFKDFEEYRNLHNLDQEFAAEIHLNYSFCRSKWTELSGVESTGSYRG
jgi:hypothetical protein